MLTYEGPKEVLVNQPVVLNGTYDPQRIASVSLVAEDRFPLNVSLNRTARSWRVALDGGFAQAGVRWLRLRGTNSGGQVVSDRRVFITVSAAPLIAASALSVQVLTDTFFKVAPVSSSSLGDDEKTALTKDTTLEVSRYGRTKAHIIVELANGDFGYLYEPHVQLRRGVHPYFFELADLPQPPPGFSQAWVAFDTKIKAKPESSSVLADSLQADVYYGQSFLIFGYASVDEHFRVTLQDDLPGFGTSGYLYAPHVRIRREGREIISYNPNAINLFVVKTTIIKKRPVDSSTLHEKERATIYQGMVYGVAGYTLESGHLKVSLTENIPGFGNTGFVFPYFVELMQGDRTIDLSGGLTYEGPNRVMEQRPVILRGRFDTRRIARVELLAEDRFPLAVTINPNSGIWQTNLDRGFQEAGSRWLRLKGLNGRGELVGSRTIQVTVTTNPDLVTYDLMLRVVKDTLFKLRPIDSADLGSQQKVLVRAGQTLGVERYGLVDGHLQLSLGQAIAPVGKFGYFYEGHVQLREGNEVLIFDPGDVPDIPATAQMLVTATTFLKAQPVDASELPASQRTELQLGRAYAIAGYAFTQGHIRVTLGESIAGFGNVGFVYWMHVQLIQDGKLVPFNPSSLTATIRESTVLKRRPIASSQLSDADKATLPTGRVYGVASYGVESDHIKVTLTEELPNYGNTGYLFPPHVLMRRGDRPFDPMPPKQVELNVPYFSQRDNPRYASSTCNVTSIAMVLYYYGQRPQSGGQLEDEMLDWVFERAGVGQQTVHSVLSTLIRAYGYPTSWSTSRRWSEVRDELNSDRPVVISGDFTASGHIVTVIGYNDNGFIINDPWGNALTGYRDTRGERLLYSYGYMNQVCGPDGNIWAHFIQRK